jgi:signal transduction histidine kinase
MRIDIPPPAFLPAGKTFVQSSVRRLGALVCTILFISAWVPAPAQPGRGGNLEIGNPIWEAHTAREYNAHGQNFAVTEDQRGLLYFGNFAGVLEYDGTTWRTILTDNYAKVSALYFDKATNRVFVGANSEFGYLKPDSIGALQFESLSKSIPASFGEITNIVKSPAGLLFIGQKNIYLWKNRLIKEWRTEDPILNTFEVNGQLYIYQKKEGISLFDGKRKQKVKINPRLPGLLDVTAMLPLDEETILVATSNQGLFRIKDFYLDRFESPANAYLAANQPNTGLVLSDGSLALATLQGGVVLLNRQGEILQLIKGDAFDNVQVNSMHQSSGGILWLALNNGIVQVDIPSPISVFDEAIGVRGEVNDLLRYRNAMYIATLNGLYYLSGFRPMAVQGINASCFQLEETPGALLAATSKGVYRVNGGSGQALTSDFSICLHSLRQNPNVVLVGLESGLSILNTASRSYRQVPGIDDQIIGITEDDQGQVWLETLSQGLYRLNPQTLALTVYGIEQGLETLLYNQIISSSEGLIAWNKNGTFRYNPTRDRFQKANLFQTDSSAANYWKGEIVEGRNGNFWTTRGDEKLVTLYRKKNQQGYEEIERPFLAFSDRTFKTIYPDADSVVWFGGPEGAIRFNLAQADGYARNYPSLIRRINLKGDSLAFNGFAPKGGSTGSPTSGRFRIGYDFNDISFQFSAASFNVGEELTFKYYLENYDDIWSDWVSQNQKEYTNLAPGRYRFRVKAQNKYNLESEESVFDFVIEKPWYQKWWAYVLYALLLGTGLSFLIRWRLRSLVKERDLLENMVTERTEEISSQKEELEKQSLELASKNDQLEKIDQIVQSINSEIEFSSLFETVLAKLNIIRNMDTATALLYDKESNLFLFKAAYGGVDMSQLENIRLTLQQAEERYLENAVEKAEDIYFKTDAHFTPLSNALDALHPPRSLITIVINVEGQVEGFITIENTFRVNAFDQSDFDMIRNLKEHLIAAFIKTRILENLEKTLTNLKVAQEELIRQERLASVGQLTRGIVDRILNPLNYINNFSESSSGLIEEIAEIVETEDISLPEDLREDLSSDMDMLKTNLLKIKEHGNSTTRIVKDMQRLLKEKSNEFFETDLNAFVESKTRLALQELKNEHKDQENNLDVVFNLNAPTVQVRVLPYEMSSVISNIVNNATYSMNEKKKASKINGYTPRLTITTEAVGKNVFVRFRDNGKGIPKQEMRQMFSPFFTTKPTSKGTGLGLYMSRDIVELHRGEIDIESVEGDFVEITIRLPVQ